jgi:hypothetical protein
VRRVLACGAVAPALVVVAVTGPAVGSTAPRSQAGQARATPVVQMMVVGRTRTLSSAASVRPSGRAITIGRKHCPVPAGTPLAGLLAARLPVHVSDAAGCDPTAMFVTQVGSDRNRGIAGWEYKVGAASPSFGAGDPGQRLRTGARLLWFWCLRATACQQTLALGSPSATPGRGAPFTVTVLGYDDNGRGRPILGASVRLGGEVVRSGAGGLATLTAPAAPGRYAISASKPGLVPSFPLEAIVR